MKEYISGFLLLLCSGILAQSVCQPRGVTVENGRIVSSSAMKTLLSDDFSKDSGNWEIVNHQDRLRMERKTFLGKPALVITTVDSKMKKDTAFMLTSKVFAVENPGQYALTFESSADFLTVGRHTAEPLLPGYVPKEPEALSCPSAGTVRIFRPDAILL